MSRTAPGIGTPGRLPAPARDAPLDPAWQPWIHLLELTLVEANDASWVDMVPAPVARPEGAPLLHGTTLRLDTPRAPAHVRRLGDAIGLPGAHDIDASELILAAITRDDGAITRIAARAGVAADTMAVIAQLAAKPLLHACARALATHVPIAWMHGWCPMCGAWPALAEMRGIERDRRLRCGCCAADWSLPVLRCAFCGEADHHRLGFLLIEGDAQHGRVETCDSCHGYLKTVMTLSTLQPHVLARHDLASVAIDLAAQDRGYARPSRPGWSPDIRLAN
ncbi:MAG TPA: formate dehydrogenase accessory protein FdhE [Gemmatimonadaceae bacterium]|jgi:FdhE protein